MVPATKLVNTKLLSHEFVYLPSINFPFKEYRKNIIQINKFVNGAVEKNCFRIFRERLMQRAVSGSYD